MNEAFKVDEDGITVNRGAAWLSLTAAITIIVIVVTATVLAIRAESDNNPPRTEGAENSQKSQEPPSSKDGWVDLGRGIVARCYHGHLVVAGGGGVAVVDSRYNACRQG